MTTGRGREKERGTAGGGRMESAKRALHDDASTRDVCEIFRVLGDPTRLNILLALETGELCARNIAAVVGMTDSAVSHQLRILKNLRLVRYRKAGRMAFYSLDDSHISRLLRIAFSHARE